MVFAELVAGMPFFYKNLSNLPLALFCKGLSYIVSINYLNFFVAFLGAAL